MPLTDARPGVLVLGGHVQGLGVVRVFGRLGIPCAVMDDNRFNLARHSKYSRSFLSYTSNNLLRALLELKNRAEYRGWMVMPTNDQQVLVLSQNKHLLQDHFVISSDDWRYVEPCYNKRSTYRLAEELKIPIPRTWMPDSRRELENLDVPFPCILKPAVMHNFYRSTKTKAFVCRDWGELLRNYHKAIQIIPADEILIQDIIPASRDNQYSACYMFNRDEAFVRLCALRKRQHPLQFGNATTYAETAENPVIMEYAEALLRRIGYCGVCEVEFMFDPRDHGFKLLEINARTWKWHAIAEKACTPFLASLYALCVEGKKLTSDGWSKAAFRHIITDVPVVLKMMSKGVYVRADRRPVQHAVWDQHDWRPALFELLCLPYIIFKR